MSGPSDLQPMRVELHPGDPVVVFWDGRTASFARDRDFARPGFVECLNTLERELLVARLRAWIDVIQP